MGVGAWAAIEIDESGMADPARGWAAHQLSA